MRVQLYLQIIGHTKASEQLDQCVDEDRTISELPPPLRSEMFHKRVPEHRFRVLLDLLYRLRLIDFDVPQHDAARAGGGPLAAAPSGAAPVSATAAQPMDVDALPANPQALNFIIGSLVLRRNVCIYLFLFSFPLFILLDSLFSFLVRI